MSRIEKDSQTKGEMVQMKEDVIKEVRKGKKGGSSKMTCSLIFLFALVVGVFFVLWIIASTGLVSIPLLSRVAYKPLEPTRIIYPGTPVDVVAQETFQTTIAYRLQEGGGEIKDKSISLKIREESLTATLRDTLSVSGLNFFDGANAQIAVLKNGHFEIFIPVTGINKESSVVLNLSAQIDDGNVVLEIGKMKLGSLTVPKALVSSLVGGAAKNELEILNKDLGSFMKIDSILYEKGQVEFAGSLTVEVVK